METTQHMTQQSIPEQLSVRGALPANAEVARAIAQSLAITRGQSYAEFLGQTNNQRPGE